MAKPPLPAAIGAFLTKPNPSVISTLRPDGSPDATATWYLWEDDRVLVNMAATRKRLDWMRQDPRVALDVLDTDDWYSHVTLRGTVVAIEHDEDLSDIDRIAAHYTGEPYRDRNRDSWSAWIEVGSWHGWGEFRSS